jgi:hypothetical protein
MIVKLDAITDAKLRTLQKNVTEQTGITPNSASLIVQVLLSWALDGLKDSTLRELAPQMLTLSQQRKAIIGEMLAFKEQLDQPQLAQMKKTLEKLKQNASKSEATSSEV